MGEKLRDAPVYFTIAQVKFNPILSLKDYMPAIQEKMRKAGFPDFKHIMTVAFNFQLTPNAPLQEGAPTPVRVDHFVFSNMESTRGFILQNNSLSFQSTDYGTYAVLTNDFLNGLEIVSQTIDISYSERIGIRYLDAVIPREGDEISKYIIPEVMGVAARLEGASVVQSFSETVAKIRDVGKIIARTIIRIGPIGFPPDLKPDELKLKKKFENINKLHAIIDTDGSFEGRESFQLDTVKNHLNDLHVEISKAFRKTTTDYARSIWL